MIYKGQLRLVDSPLQVTIWVNRLRAVDFTLGYEVRSVLADPDSKPAVIAETQLAAFDIEEQRWCGCAPHHREYLAAVACDEPERGRSAVCGSTTPRTVTISATFVDAGAAPRRRRRDPAAGTRPDARWSPGSQPGFDVLASRVVGGRVRPADLSAGADALARALPDAGPLGLRRSRLCDGLGVARRAAARQRVSSTSTTCPPGWCSTWRSGGSRWPRSTAAPTARRRRCWIRRSSPSAPAAPTSASRCGAYSP